MEHEYDDIDWKTRWELSKRFGRTIRRLRENRGMTQKELATFTPYTSSYISQLERGEAEILHNPFGVISGLCRGLSVPKDYLFSKAYIVSPPIQQMICERSTKMLPQKQNGNT